MSDDVRSEVYGRLVLWLWVLHDVRDLLRHRQRHHSASLNRPIETDEERTRGFRNFVATQPDTIPGSTRLSHINEFERRNPSPYGTFSDAYSAKVAIEMIVVVLICQLFNTGHGEPGRVARNTKDFVSDHWSEVYSQALTKSEIASWTALTEKCFASRDRMLAHADGPAFSINEFSSENGRFTTCRSRYVSVREIDFDEALQLVDKLVEPLEAYMANFQASGV